MTKKIQCVRTHSSFPSYTLVADVLGGETEVKDGGRAWTVLRQGKRVPGKFRGEDFEPPFPPFLIPRRLPRRKAAWWQWRKGDGKATLNLSLQSFVSVVERRPRLINTSLPELWVIFYVCIRHAGEICVLRCIIFYVYVFQPFQELLPACFPACLFSKYN